MQCYYLKVIRNLYSRVLVNVFSKNLFEDEAFLLVADYKYLQRGIKRKTITMTDRRLKNKHDLRSGERPPKSDAIEKQTIILCIHYYKIITRILTDHIIPGHIRFFGILYNF